MYSVIIPSVGRLKYLNELLESIFSQSLPPLEIIILLDFNMHCKSIQEKINTNKICKIIFCNDMNLSQKRNYGTKISKTEYLMFSDDDDLWDVDKGKQVFESLKRNLIVTHDYKKFGNIVNNKKSFLGTHNKLINKKTIIYGANIYGGGSSLSANKEVFTLFQFNENLKYCEDYDWWLRVLSADIKVAYIGKPLVKYRVHDNNMTSHQFVIFKYKLIVIKALFVKGFLIIIGSLIGILRSFFSLIFGILLNLSLNKIIKKIV